MRTVTETLYECESCRRRFVVITDCERHETDCRAKAQRRERQTAAAELEAINCAVADEALGVLVRAGLTDAARARASDILDNVDFTPDCSLWFTSMVDRMILRAKEHNHA
jgi:hypothetical protein